MKAFLVHTLNIIAQTFLLVGGVTLYANGESSIGAGLLGVFVAANNAHRLLL